MRSLKRKRFKVSGALAVALAGGTLFGGCEVRLKDAIVSGTKDYILTGLLPSLVSNDRDSGGSDPLFGP
ncbi:MAG: hypothetical protein KJ749_12155 [Planctomycetes bacterium]|nr:hypothetical protein [Planctomycetota bacterium]